MRFQYAPHLFTLSFSLSTIMLAMDGNFDKFMELHNYRNSVVKTSGGNALVSYEAVISGPYAWFTISLDSINFGFRLTTCIKRPLLVVSPNLRRNSAVAWWPWNGAGDVIVTLSINRSTNYCWSRFNWRQY